MADDTQLPPTTLPLDEVSGRALVEAWRASGLSGAAFCRQHDLRAQRLHYWRERLGYPIKVVRPGSSPATAGAPATEGFIQMIVAPTEVASSVIPTTHVDIVVGGAVIRVRAGFDAGLVRAVVVALGSGS